MWNEEYLKTLTEGERSLVEWQYRMCGGFFTALWDAIQRADVGNLDRLSRAFPEHVEAYLNYARVDGWWEDIQRGLFAREVDDVEDHG